MKTKFPLGCSMSLILVCALCWSAPRASAIAYTTTTLTVKSGGSAVTTVSLGTAVTLTATVIAGSVPVTQGTVKFCNAHYTYCEDAHLLGTAQLTSAGTAVLKYRPGVGSHAYKAVFVGTTAAAGSASSASALTVTNSGGYPTLTTISAQGPVQGPFALTATVGTTGGVAPTGNVSFLDTSNGNALLGTGILTSNANGPVSSPVSGATAFGATDQFSIGDFNGDGIPDLADLGASGYPTIYLGNGDGTFTAAEIQPTGVPLASSIAAGDFNSDGMEDLVLGTANGVTVLLGNGDGTFTTQVNSALSNLGAVIGVADFDGDGKLDIAVYDAGVQNVGQVMGVGDGTFAGTSWYAIFPPNDGYNYANYDPQFAIGDFYGNGHADIAIGGCQAGSSGTHAWTECVITTYIYGYLPYETDLFYNSNISSFVTADFNGDGQTDLAMIVDNAYQFTLLSGWNSQPMNYVGQPLSAEVAGDFNGDGIPDLWMTSGSSPNLGSIVLQGNGDGTFTTETLQQFPAQPANTGNIVSADLNGDGIPDVVLGGEPTLLTMPESAIATPTGITFSEGTGTHQVAVRYPGDSSHSASESATVGLQSPGPITTLETTSLSFGSITVGQTSASQTAVLTNAGDAPLSITGIALTGPNASSFDFANNCGTGLPAGGQCEIHGHFAPIAPGALSATISITDNAGNSPQTIALSGTGVGMPTTVAFSATSLSFGSITVGETSASQQVVVTNTGSAALSIASIAVTGTNASSFVFANTCGTSLAVGASCTIHGHFAPTTDGALTASVTITDDAATSPQTIALSGTGVGMPVVTLSATSMTFAATSVGATSGSLFVTAANSGNAALSIASVAITGADASSFESTNSCGARLAVGASCYIYATFAPTASGALTAAITITDGASTSPQTVTLSGTGLAQTVKISATSLSFADTYVGFSTGSQSVTVTNTGSTALSIASVAIGGYNPSSFVFANNCGASLAAGASCTIHGHFAPTESGELQATIAITDSALTSPQYISLNGFGIPLPVGLSSTSLSFGAVNVGTSSGSQSVLVTNQGGNTITFTSIAVTGPNASSFVFSNNCGTSLGSGASCSISGHFTPTAIGALTAAITLTDNALESPQTITLSGIGATPQVSLSSASLAFGSIPENTPAEGQSVTLTNVGTGPLNIASIAITGTNASQFAFANDCGTSLASGSSCVIHGHFAPTTLGAASASITITDNAHNSPQSISLSGTGVAATSGVTLSATSLPVGSTPTNLVFGPVVVGSTGTYDTVIVTNTGSSTLSISSIAVTGANASEFSFGNTCGATLAVGATCVIQGDFAPSAVGSMTASVTITDSDATSPQTIALSGTGTAPSGAVTLSARSLSYSATTAGTASSSQSVTMTNSVTSALTITSITVAGSDPSSFVFGSTCGSTLTSGASCAIHGHFAPVTTGALTATITITDSATGSSQSIALKGTGQ